jgi:hypothetical protein
LRAVLDERVDFLSKRLAAASPPNDGKQTPFKGHPVFTVQHATATCAAGVWQSGTEFRKDSKCGCPNWRTSRR